MFISVSLGFLLGLFVLFATPFSQHFWFFVPAAVSVVIASRQLPLKLIPAISIILTIIGLGRWQSGVTDLDVMGLILFYLMGVYHYSLLKYEGSFLKSILIPLWVGTAAAVLVFISGYGLQYFTGDTVVPLKDFYPLWADKQMMSVHFPAFFQPESWIDWTRDAYETVFRPILRLSVFAWFGCMMASAFFLNTILVAVFEAGSQIWQEFGTWKAPDWTLILLVAGLACLAASTMVPGDYWKLVGWNLATIAFFPIFLQGTAVTSFLIPRASLLLLILIFIVLILDPVPILLLAGVGDLWFDFRSRFGSNPES